MLYKAHVKPPNNNSLYRYMLNIYIREKCISDFFVMRTYAVIFHSPYHTMVFVLTLRFNDLEAIVIHNNHYSVHDFLAIAFKKKFRIRDERNIKNRIAVVCRSMLHGSEDRICVAVKCYGAADL